MSEREPTGRGGSGGDDLREDLADLRDAMTEAGVDPDDPLVDTAVRRIEAQADEDNPYGRRGRPFNQRSPVRLGFSAAIGVALAYLLVESVIAARQVLTLVLVSLFLAVGLEPAVNALARRRIGRRGAIAIVFAAVIAFFGGFAALAVPPLVSQTTDFVQHQLPDYVDRLQSNPRVQSLDKQFGLLDQAKSYLSNGQVGQRAFGGIVGVGKVVLNATFSTLTVLVLTLYFTGALPRMKRQAYMLVPRSRRARVGLLTDEVLARVGGYVAGALGIAAIAGTTSLVFLEVVGVPFGVALAMLVAITDLIPLIGATVGAVIVTAVAFFDSTTAGIACAVWFLVYQQVENYLIYPRVMKSSVDVHPAATVVAVLVGGALLGVVGALLAIPTAAAIKLLMDEVLVPRQDAA